MRTHTYRKAELSVWTRLSRMPWAKCLLLMEKVTPSVDIPVLQVNACALPSCQWETGCPSHQHYKIQPQPPLPDAKSSNLEGGRKDKNKTKNTEQTRVCLYLFPLLDPRRHRPQPDSENPNLTMEKNATSWFRHSFLHQHLCKQRCLSAVWGMCVSGAGYEHLAPVRRYG